MVSSLRFAALLACIQCASTRHVRPVHVARSSTLALQGNLLPLGIFYTHVEVGTPARSFAVTVDTGSTDMLLPVAGCSGCKHNTTLYDPSTSSTSAIEVCNASASVFCQTCAPSVQHPKTLQCGFEDTYLTCDLSNLTATCSVSGGVYSDVLSVGDGLAAKHVRFGAIQKQSLNFDQFRQIDGIFGLAYKGHSMGFDESPFERLVEQNSGLDNVIQTCLTPNGGLLVFGQDEARDRGFYTGELQWTPITLKAWYTINATDLSVGDRSLHLSMLDLNGPFPSDPCIVDSGTNFLSLTTPAFQAVRAAFEKKCSQGANLTGVCGVSRGAGLFDGKAWVLTPTQKEMFPDVSISLVGKENRDVHLPIGPTEYFVEVSTGTYRLGITEGDCIIGNTHMLKYWTVYDRANSRIGFAPAIKAKCLQERTHMLKQP